MRNFFLEKNGGHIMLWRADYFRQWHHASAGGSGNGLVDFIRTAGIDLRRYDISVLPGDFSSAISIQYKAGAMRRRRHDDKRNYTTASGERGGRVD
jgi:hypothetical protein